MDAYLNIYREKDSKKALEDVLKISVDELNFIAYVQSFKLDVQVEKRIIKNGIASDYFDEFTLLNIGFSLSIYPLINEGAHLDIFPIIHHSVGMEIIPLINN